MKIKLNKNNILSSESGFTLIEVLMAIAVFSIGMLAVAALQTQGLTRTRLAREATECMNLANRHADRLMSLPMYQVEFTTQHPDLTAGTHTFLDDSGRYRIGYFVRDDVPIPKQTNPISSLLPDITVSKSINIQVRRVGDPNDSLASLEFIKVLME